MAVLAPTAAVPARRGARVLPGGRAVLIGVAGLTLVSVVVLLGVIIVIAFQRQGTPAVYTLDNIRQVYGDPFLYSTLLNTAGYTAVIVLTALFCSVPLALLAERTDLPGRSLIFPLMTSTALIPGFFTALGWLFMFHPRIGMVNLWLMHTFPFIHGPLLNVATIPGMGIVTGLSLSSLSFIMLAGTFRNMDPSLEESARVHGLGAIDQFRYVIYPLAWPGVLAAGLYVATIGLATFDVPAVIGLGNRIFVFSTYVWMLTNPQEGQPQFNQVAASSLVMIVVALVLSWWYLRVIGRSHRYAVVTGKNYRPRLIHLSTRWVVAGWSFIAVLLLGAVVFPLLLVFWGSLLPYFQPVSATALQVASFKNYTNVPWEQFWGAARNTAILVVTVPTLLIFLGLAVSWVVVRSGSKLAGLFDTLAFVPHAVPNLIFAVAVLVVGLTVIPRWVPFYGTVAILIFTFTVVRISFPTRLFNNALIQIHRELDEAAYVFGLGPVEVVRSIFLPLLGPVVLYAWIWSALLAYRELTLAAFLSGAGNLTLPVYILSFVSQGRTPIAAAVSMMLIAFMVPLVALYFLIGRGRVQYGA